MTKKQLLFVTYHDENIDEGLSYAVDLARTMNDSIEILMVYNRKVFERLEEMMTAVTFAEAGEFKTARDMISEDYRNNNGDYEARVAELKEKCLKSGVQAGVSNSAADVVSAIKNIVKQNTKIDMILLSPSVTKGGAVTSKVINKLVKAASRPIITMAKQAGAA